jgi:formate hydrogenlyase subunit 3/multisubunit Na+/H+ antiporter MnhD subunit
MLNLIGAFLSRGANLIWFMIALPVAFGGAAWALKKRYAPQLALTMLFSAANLLFSLGLYNSAGFYKKFPLVSPELDIAFRVYEYSAMFLVFAAVGFLLICLYDAVYLKDRGFSGRFMFFMGVSLAMINGALLSDNLGVMLFFWEGLLCTLFGMLLIGNAKKPQAAAKALALSGTADLLLMLGIIITAYRAGTPYISEMTKLPVAGVNALGFALMMLGAVGKAGCMPFHSWIPDAADDAPTPFMVAFPAALEKFLGIYLAIRVARDIYDLRPGSGMSVAVMTLGTLTILFAVAMALIQKDMKRLLSYHAVSQVGYMVLGIGTALPVGFIGALYHMLNNAIYKSCLFMTAGSVEKQTGTTDLRKIGGLAKSMPVTAVCFAVSAFAIAGIPPFNGFFSKELIFDAALESNAVFYIGALLGAFLTAVSFLKMGRAAFAGARKLPEGKESVSETRFGMLLPMGILAALCVLFGVVNRLPLDGFLGSSLGQTESYSGWPHSSLLVVISLVTLALAVCDHVYGSKKTGCAINAADHIHNAPGLRSIYAMAEKHWFDPYDLMMGAVNGFSNMCTAIEKGVTWLYDDALVGAATGAGLLLHRLNNGRPSQYLGVALVGVACIVAVFLAVLL